MTQLVLPLHECATESVADPATAEFVTDLIATESATTSVAVSDAAESAAEPLYSVVDPAVAPTKTSCLCVLV
jgi:hypothetical protein